MARQISKQMVNQMKTEHLPKNKYRNTDLIRDIPNKLWIKDCVFRLV
jgi:hypothetical protein